MLPRGRPNVLPSCWKASLMSPQARADRWELTHSNRQSSNQQPYPSEKNRASSKKRHKQNRHCASKSVEELDILVEVLQEDLNASQSKFGLQMPTPYGQVSAPESQSPWIERVGNPPSEEHWESIPFQPRSPDISWHPFGCGAMEGCPTPTNIFRNQCEEERRWQKFQLQQEEARLRNISMEKLLEPDPHGNRPLHGAVTQGRRALAYALAWRMAYLNKIDEKDTAKQTALHIAARKNHQLIAGDLIALGANVNAKDILGKTPLHLCAEKGNLAVLEVLQSCQQNGTHVEVDVTNNQGLTPLQGGALAHAALVKDLEIPGLSLDIKQVLALRKDRILRGICCLVEMGADPWVQGTTSSDQTSHCFAKMQEDKELMNAFQIYGPRRTQESGSLRNRDALQCLQAERIDSPAVLFSKLLDQFLGPSLM
ncbi:ankyrin repeat domain-containing protein 35-like isoform X2 [Anolis carolinensis]|uniref:ankyrin repeat domain-containing protein 35 isoform X2 n=1 Tax=Anolis carolinensis TaxID=28377 RepID=UPI002F2B6959